MGLNESYSYVRSDVLLKRPVLTVNQAYSVVVQKESQRKLGVVEVNRDPLTMLAGKGQAFKNKKLGLVCEYCGYKGHLKENCYKIIGYPPDFKSKKKGQFNPRKPHANIANTDEDVSAKNQYQQGNYFTEDQYKQLLSLLTKSTAGDNTSGFVGSSNLAGTISLLSNAQSYNWIVDSGASHHITFCKNILESIKEIDKDNNDGVQIPTCSRSEITHTGDAIVMETQRITNVLRVPDFKFNLLSMSKLTKELYCSACFYPDFVVFQGLFNGKCEVITVLRKFLSLIKNQFGTTIKVLRFDNGTEFFNAKCSGETVKTAVYLINKLPTRVLDGKSPYEMLHGKPLKIEHLRVFGCICYASILPKGDKLSPRARRTVLIGYSETQKGYMLFNLDSKTFLVSRDVSFRENFFPFKQLAESSEDLFLSSSIEHTECAVQPTQQMCEPTSGQSLQGTESNTITGEGVAQVEEDDNGIATDEIDHVMDVEMDNGADVELDSEMEN
ncbi:uncharacterized protein [Nicotiana tomentosiformis]|uniref:uncharacterized protein n=1 Tax=Nicotiana tomentosiformis TaxID=4098 RepID=UPI00388CC897